MKGVASIAFPAVLLFAAEASAQSAWCNGYKNQLDQAEVVNWIKLHYWTHGPNASGTPCAFSFTWLSDVPELGLTPAISSGTIVSYVIEEYFHETNAWNGHFWIYRANGEAVYQRRYAAGEKEKTTTFRHYLKTQSVESVCEALGYRKPKVAQGIRSWTGRRSMDDGKGISAAKEIGSRE